MSNTTGNGSHKPQAGDLSAEVRSAVKSELDSILAAPAFSHSNRCKRFLSYVVRETLSGNLDQLKERIIGVKVFDRAYDYDTGDDSIVRVTANEVRKRISQFYQESSQAHPIQIDLPRGSYVPEFRIHPVNHGHAHEDDHARGHEEAVAPNGALPAKDNTPPPSLPSPVRTEASVAAMKVLRRDIIPIDDATSLSSIVGLLGEKDIPFRIVGAEKATLIDLQEQPVILIGAMDNQWTIQLTQGLRYRISASFPLGPNYPPVATIADAEKSSQLWRIDFSAPLSERKTDYAIVAREDDATLGVPVLIVAGLGNLGTLAASELVTSDALTAKLAAEPACHSKSSFEAVVETTIDGAKPGPPSVLRLACW